MEGPKTFFLLYLQARGWNVETKMTFWEKGFKEEIENVKANITTFKVFRRSEAGLDDLDKIPEENVDLNILDPWE